MTNNSNAKKTNKLELTQEQFDDLSRYIQQADVGRTRAMQTLGISPGVNNIKSEKSMLKFSEVLAQIVGTMVAIIIMVVGITASYYGLKEQNMVQLHLIKEDVSKMSVKVDNIDKHVDDIEAWADNHEDVVIDSRDLEILEARLKLYIDKRISEYKSALKDNEN